MTPTDLKRLRDEAAEDYCDQPRCAQVNRSDKAWHRLKDAFQQGFDKAVELLTKAADAQALAPFDEQAAFNRAPAMVAGPGGRDAHDFFMDGARWQFDQLAERVRSETERADTNFNTAKVAVEGIAKLEERIRELEAELANAQSVAYTRKIEMLRYRATLEEIARHKDFVPSELELRITYECKAREALNAPGGGEK